MSYLIGQLKTAIREHALPSCPTYQMMIDCADEIKMLRQRVIDCNSCIERRENVMAEMRGDLVDAKNAEVVAWGELDSVQAENERLQARVAILDKKIIDIAAKSELAASMMDGDERGQNIADAFLVIRDFATKKLERIRSDAGKAGGNL